MCLLPLVSPSGSDPLSEQRGLHDPGLSRRWASVCPGGNLRRHPAALSYSFDLLAAFNEKTRQGGSNHVIRSRGSQPDGLVYILPSGSEFIAFDF